MSKAVNGQIKNVFLGFEDHGIFTLLLTIEYDCYNQVFGGYNLCKNASRYLMDLMKTFECKNFDELKGKYCTVLLDENDVIEGLGHITKKDKKFLHSSIMKISF